MNTLNKLILCLSAVAFALPQNVRAQSGALSKSWAGTWHLNTTKSKFSSAEFTPKSETRTYALSGNRLTMKASTVNAAGKTINWSYSASPDGKVYRTSGNPTIDQIAVTYVSPREFKASSKLKGKPAARTTAILSADGKKLTITRSILTAKGGPTNDTLVYDRR